MENEIKIENNGVERSDRVWTYQEVSSVVDQAWAALSARGITPHPMSTLAELFNQARKLANNWESCGSDDNYLDRLIDLNHANRIAMAILTVEADPAAVDCLKRVAKNSVDLSKREISQGKDALWEIELLWRLRGRGVKADLRDPLDIVADFGFGSYALACKKVYSEKGVEMQVRKGAQQIERSGIPGIVAINIDDLAPANSLVAMRKIEDAMDFLASFAKAFLDRHQLRTQRFVLDGRCDGLLVSISTPGDIEMSSPRFNNITQTMLWTLHSASVEAKSRIAKAGSFLLDSKL
jgi:hypothetical protein